MTPQNLLVERSRARSSRLTRIALIARLRVNAHRQPGVSRGDELTSTISSTIVDGYETRSSARCTASERHDPVFWTYSDDGPLSAVDQIRYEDKGFHNIPSLLSPDEVSGCYNEISRLASSPALQGDRRIVRERDNGEVRSIFDVHLLSDVVARIARRPDILAMMRQIPRIQRLGARAQAAVPNA